MQGRRVSSRRVRASLVALLLALMMVVSIQATASGSGTVTYTNTQTIAVPPASSYAGSGSGDGWSLAFSATEVFNVFHHQGPLQVACHEQSDASECYSPVTVQDGDGHFGSSGHPGMYFDPSTQHLLVYVTRDDSTAGVVCFDTQHATTAPFCGFTALTAVGDGYYPDMSNLSDTITVGGKFYAYNYVPGAGVTSDENTLLCCGLSSSAGCSGQPYAPPFNGTTLNSYYFPEPQVALISGKILVATTGDAGGEISCFDPSTAATCSGSWPIAAPSGYTSNYGAPYPLPSSSGAVQGFCLPTATDPCWSLSGASLTTPAGMPAAIPGSVGWNGQAVVLGPRVYVANGAYENEVFCYDASTDAKCANFPKTFDNPGYIYTTTLDPQRPSCIWVNADNGSDQIQNFDAYTGGACGEGPIRVLASSFVVDTPTCAPGSYTSLQVLSPSPSDYTSGGVEFLDGDGHPLGYTDRPLDSTGTADLTGLDLNSSSGLPEFLITLNGASGDPTAVTVKLTWTGQSDPSCTANGATIVTSRPIVTEVSPSSGPASGGQSITITGSGFTGATRVVFGRVRVTSFTVVSDTEITVSTPPLPGGHRRTVQVRVHTAVGLSAKAAAALYRYTRS